MSKADKLQLEKEKTEREATLKKSDKADASAAPQPPSSPQFAGL